MVDDAQLAPQHLLSPAKFPDPFPELLVLLPNHPWTPKQHPFQSRSAPRGSGCPSPGWWVYQSDALGVYL